MHVLYIHNDILDNSTLLALHALFDQERLHEKLHHSDMFAHD